MSGRLRGAAAHREQGPGDRGRGLAPRRDHLLGAQRVRGEAQPWRVHQVRRETETVI